jgi:hypothetical protein
VSRIFGEAMEVPLRSVATEPSVVVKRLGDALGRFAEISGFVETAPSAR